MPANTAFYNAKELSELLGISTSTAYVQIREINELLNKKGFRAPKAGLVSKNLVHDLFMFNGVEDLNRFSPFEDDEKEKIAKMKKRYSKKKEGFPC